MQLKRVRGGGSNELAGSARAALARFPAASTTQRNFGGLLASRQLEDRDAAANLDISRMAPRHNTEGVYGRRFQAKRLPPPTTLTANVHSARSEGWFPTSRASRRTYNQGSCLERPSVITSLPPEPRMMQAIARGETTLMEGGAQRVQCE